jgi:hypothetical protein
VTGVAEDRDVRAAEQRKPTGTLYRPGSEELEERVVVERSRPDDAGITEVLAGVTEGTDLDIRQSHASSLS